MADTPTTTTTAPATKTWWQAGLEALGGFVRDAGEGYDKYMAGRLSEKVADQVKKTPVTDWNKIAKIAIGVAAAVAVIWGLIWFLGRGKKG